MSMYHRCRTCGTEYPCNCRWCPGCGKRLGHSEWRGADAARTDESGRLGHSYRCSTCGSVTIDVPGPRYCSMCGAKFTREGA